MSHPPSPTSAAAAPPPPLLPPVLLLRPLSATSPPATLANPGAFGFAREEPRRLGSRTQKSGFSTGTQNHLGSRRKGTQPSGFPSRRNPNVWVPDSDPGAFGSPLRPRSGSPVANPDASGFATEKKEEGQFGRDGWWTEEEEGRRVVGEGGGRAEGGGGRAEGGGGRKRREGSGWGNTVILADCPV